MKKILVLLFCFLVLLLTACGGPDLLFCFLVLLLTACGGPEKKAEKPAEPAKKEEPAKPAEPSKNAEGKQVLNLFSWADNFDPEVLADFEKKFNCKINYDVFANNEELLAKIQAGGARYDVIQPSDYMITTMLKLNLLEELDMSKIPNTKNLIKDLQAPAYDPTGTHSVVYSWGITGIAYNKKYVKTPPTSWRDLWNPAYKGRVVLLNDVREVISFAMKMHGHSLNSVDKNHLAECMKDLKALAPNILAYDTDTIKQKFIAEEAWIGTMWSGDAYFSFKENKAPASGPTALPSPKAPKTKPWPRSSSTICMIPKSAPKTMNTSVITIRTWQQPRITPKNSKTILS